MKAEELRKIANLARLDLSDEELAGHAEQFSAMLGYMENIRSLDLSEVEPMTRVDESRGVLRKDEVVESLSREEAFRNAPAVDQNHFTVPRVIG